MISSEQKEYWNRVAATRTFTHPLDMEFIGKWIVKEAHIIDYGCGYGRIVQQLHGAGYTNVKGFDTSAELIQRGQTEGVSNLFVIQSHTALPVEDQSVDMVLLFAVLTCIPSNAVQKELIEVIHSKMKPGGLIYISDYYLQDESLANGRYGFLNDDPDNYGVFTLAEGATFRHHTREWMTSLLQSFSLKHERIIEVKTMNGNSSEAFQWIGTK
jgi:SAM-dependent methyltransferase